MGPEDDLPLPSGYESASVYVDDLLQFVATSDLLQLLCGGVHILDFFTRTPDLYAWLLPKEWSVWFEKHELSDLLDLFLREDLSNLVLENDQEKQWRGESPPPASLISYISKIRSLSLKRDFEPSNIDIALSGPVKGQIKKTESRRLPVGMKEKKAHEVDHFARYVNELTVDVAAYTGHEITHIVDFGSGQNYLGRTLASPPYNKHVIAVESKHGNVEGAKAMDIRANLAPKTSIWRNKKEWRAQQQNQKADVKGSFAYSSKIGAMSISESKHPSEYTSFGSTDLPSVEKTISGHNTRIISYQPSPGGGSIQYVEHRLENGNLNSVIEEYISLDRLDTRSNELCNHEPQQDSSSKSPHLMIVSLHSCGNLTHHGLRALTLNPFVSTVALVGCCYNLTTERLTPPSYKLPSLRPPPAPSKSPSEPPSAHFSKKEFASTDNNVPADLEAATGDIGDPHGFPMSARLAASDINLNITARMMAVQAPYNWSKEDSARFFTRHYFRALLQKIFVDREIVEPPPDTLHMSADEIHTSFVSGAQSNNAVGVGGATQPVILGSLRKSCYKDFISYVRGAVEKLTNADGNQVIADLIRDKMVCMPENDIRAYAEAYAGREKEVSIVWSLMALSATLVEAVVVVDRWLWLREQMGDEEEAAGVPDENNVNDTTYKLKTGVSSENCEGTVKRAWVQSVFDYAWSPRNLVLVGVKKR